MVAVFQEAKPKLLKLYAKYAATSAQDKSKDSANSTTWPQLLSAVGLKAMLYDGGMFCAGDVTSHDAVFEAAVDQSFSGMRDVRLPEDQRLVFAEFLEVVARVALAVLGHEHDLPPKDAIKIALDALRSLPLKPVVVATATASRRK